MPKIDIDFDVFKAITARRDNEDVSENDVLRMMLGLAEDQKKPHGKASWSADVWVSEGVRFAVGSKLRHRFRGGETARAFIVSEGVETGGVTYPGFSPAAAAVTGHQVNGWQFWEILRSDGSWAKVDSLRN